jgi:hypothetical protein
MQTKTCGIKWRLSAINEWLGKAESVRKRYVIDKPWPGKDVFFLTDMTHGRKSRKFASLSAAKAAACQFTTKYMTKKKIPRVT